MKKTIIEVQGLKKKFKEQEALAGIDFSIREGEIFGFLGPSGSGKTTTINILTGQLSADSGTAHVLSALLNAPKILFLDEPTSGLDPSTSRTIHELLLELKAQGTTIFLTTHDMQEATLLCDRLALLSKGKLVEIGSPHEIIQKYNTDKKVCLEYADLSTKTVALEELQGGVNLSNVISIHSCEPTLEDVFITLTGGTLNV